MLLKKQCANCNSYYSYDVDTCPNCQKAGCQPQYKRLAIERLLLILTLGFVGGLVSATKDSSGDAFASGAGITILAIISFYFLYHYFGKNDGGFGWISDKYAYKIPEHAKTNFSFSRFFSEILYFIIILVVLAIGFGILALWQWARKKSG
jgi:hypothetical protein